MQLTDSQLGSLRLCILDLANSKGTHIPGYKVASGLEHGGTTLEEGGCTTATL